MKIDNIKPTTLMSILCIITIIIIIIMYKYLNNRMKNDLYLQKKKLKKYYERYYD